MNLATHDNGGDASVGEKKRGRPTDNPKDITLKIRFDKDTYTILGECSEKENVSKAEIVRRGVHLVNDDLNK